MSETEAVGITEALENGANGNTKTGEDGVKDLPGKDDDRKLFVGGLSWETTEKELRDYFSDFGEIATVSLKTEASGRSRGFAFIIFAATESVQKVMDQTEHMINGKKVDAKKAKSRPGKIFVGGLKTEITDEEIRTHFSQFGNIVEMELPQDKLKNQRKGFCFITFDQLHVVQELVRLAKTTINGVELDVKKAVPRTEGAAARGAMAGGRGGRGGGGWGGGYGGYGGGYGGYGGYGGGYGYDAYGGGYGDFYGGGYGGGYGGYGGGGYGDFRGKMRGGARGGRHRPY